MFGLFPTWLVELVLERATPIVSARDAIAGYTRACAAWGGHHLADVEDPATAAALLYRVVDSADVTALPLIAGWRHQERPDGPAEQLAHALMLARELRGGLHFAALRTHGLSVPEAAVLDPGGGRGRLLRTGWRAEDADALIVRVQRRTDAADRWLRAERDTDETFAAAMAVLDEENIQRLVDLLTRYVTKVQSQPLPIAGIRTS